MGPSPVPQGPWWSWGIGEQCKWWLERMEDGEKSNGGEDGGLRFSLQFDPGKLGLDRALLGLPVSALLGHLLGWSSQGASMAVAEGGGEGETAAGVAALASAFAVYLVATYASDHRRQPQQPRRPLRLRKRDLSPLNSSRPRALPTPDDGLRILSSNEECLETVIHGASVGAGDDEPEIVARVVMPPAADDDMAAGANAGGGGGGGDRSEKKEREEEEDEEVERLKELWLSLMEREQRLQLRQAELDELREQDATARELDRRAAAAAAVEARMLELKAASLREENRRLEEARASELDAVRGKLARAREKLAELRARVEREREEAAREAAALRARASALERSGAEREVAAAAEAAALRDRVAGMEKDGAEREGALAAEAEAARRRMAELEKNVEEREAAMAAEAAALRAANAGLEEENMELALRLQEAEQTASTVNLVIEEDVVKEAKYLRETNERLTRQIEQLHADHCAHVEELVYLKWVNACLRYELRTHDGDDGAGRISARDLSKSMSFRSSEKAKELMLKYGTHGLDGFDPSIFSPLHESVYGDGDGDDFEQRRPNGDVVVDEAPRSPSTAVAMAAAAAGAESPSRRGNKLKFLGNIKKLLPTSKKGHGRGDRRSSRKQSAAAEAEPPRDEHLEKALQWLSSHDVLDDDDSYESTPLSSCERTPLSSVTTAGSTHARSTGGAAGETAAAAASRLLEAETARARSDVGASSYGREAPSRYHALRPYHPGAGAGNVGGDGPRASPEKRELRRRSEELRSPASMFAGARDNRMHQLQSNA
ncbi:uncharacterized protein [Oryza sativa Japonica Group]|uniref:uncharacterized protein isoform X2 n=1 Tax=Oryza sativa subsp. japonica TaxID=39947 RepID=UPI00077544E0|nr:uncharacterized protein LOC4324195 isoform X2 [Oryza sativa Japonica Group]KAF2950882.1 hypothetical protein DAI22_01g219500 [Oryza sativa Japonica Group]